MKILSFSCNLDSSIQLGMMKPYASFVLKCFTTPVLMSSLSVLSGDVDVSVSEKCLVAKTQRLVAKEEYDEVLMIQLREYGAAALEAAVIRRRFILQLLQLRWQMAILSVNKYLRLVAIKVLQMEANEQLVTIIRVPFDRPANSIIRSLAAGSALSYSRRYKSCNYNLLGYTNCFVICNSVVGGYGLESRQYQYKRISLGGSSNTHQTSQHQ